MIQKKKNQNPSHQDQEQGGEDAQIYNSIPMKASPGE